MFSKSEWLWALTLSVVLVGCQRLTGEKPANIPTSKNAIGTEARCISKSTSALKEFFKGTTTASEISSAWSCFEGALDLFGKKVRGANPDYYHAHEISDFIEGYLVDESTRIGTGLMTEILRLKQMFVGGRDDRLTREELQALHQLTRVAGQLSTEILDEMKIYSSSWKVGPDRAQARTEFAASEISFASKLLKYWPLMKGSYDLRNLQGLADALVRSFPESENMLAFQSAVRKYLPVAISAKNILLKDQVSVVAAKDWSTILKHGPAIYSRYLYGCYFLPDNWFWGEHLTDVDHLVRESLNVFQALLRDRGNGSMAGVTITELNQLAEGIGSAELLGRRFSADTLKSLVPVLVKRILTPPGQRLAGNPETTLGPVAIETFVREFESFMAVQSKLNNLWAATGTWSHRQLQTAFAGTAGALAELAGVIESPLSLAFDSDEHLYLDPTVEISYTPSAALKLNIARAIARIGIRTYAGEPKRVDDLVGLNKEEVTVDLFEEFRPVLVGAELIAPTNVTFAKSRFIEANLFTPTANGDDLLDFHEAAAIALMIWSGINVNGELPIQASCQVGPLLNVFSATCAMEQMRVEVPTKIKSMPWMGIALTSMPQADGHKMLMDLLVAAGWEVNPEGTAKTSDIGLVPHVLQYIESVFRRWDLNKDGFIDKTETLAAEPTFRPLLATVSGQTDPALLRAAFAWIVAYQTNPMDDPWGFFDFMGDESKWVINVDRAGIGRILGFIADQIRKKNRAQLQPVIGFR